jgi:hypothetical protein
MPASELERLVDVIDSGINTRGIYLLMDERIDLICGPDALRHVDKPEVTEKISDFSTQHGWSVTRSQAGFLFLPANGEVDFSSF